MQVQQKSDEEQAQVHIPVAKREDTGKYTITASNPFGEDSGLISVVVLGMPRLLYTTCSTVICSSLFSKNKMKDRQIQRDIFAS